MIFPIRYPAMLALGLLASTCAQASVQVAATDSTTGLTWAKATTLEEGAASGYRAATQAEFSQFLSNGGFGAPSAAQEFFSRDVRSPLMGLQPDTYLPSALPYEYSNPSIAMGWLDGSQETLGAILATTGRQQSQCSPYDYYYSCYKAIYVNEAAFGSLSGMLAGQHDRYAYGEGGDWKGALSSLKQADGSYRINYLVVSGVPEPSTYATMGLGLLGMGLLAWRRRAD